MLCLLDLAICRFSTTCQMGDLVHTRGSRNRFHKKPIIWGLCAVIRAQLSILDFGRSRSLMISPAATETGG